MQNMGMQNIGTQILNTGIQMINMGIQMLNVAKDLPINSFEIPNLSQQIQNMGIQIQNIGMNFNNNQMNMNIPNPNMMQMMQMQMMMNMMNNNMEYDPNQWTLIFEERNDFKTYIRISPDKTIREAINLYKIRTNRTEDENEIKFVFEGKLLNYNLTIAQSNLKNNSKIVVLSINDIIGAS